MEHNAPDAYGSGPPRTIKSYVLRAGRLTPAQEKAYARLSDQLLVPYQAELVDFTAVFGNTGPVIAEIGFGSGCATALIAQANPDKNYLGIEVHRPGIGRLLWEAERRRLANIRIIEYDAAAVMERMIPDSALDGIHLFFPDPWPKKRHHKRRLVTRPFTGVLAQKLKTGAYLYMVTDWEDYAAHALDELRATPGLVNAYDDFAPPQSWRPQTRFEAKGLAKNHTVRELFFVKEQLSG